MMVHAGIVYAGTDDGIAMWSNADEGSTWRQIGHELCGNVVQAILLRSALEVLVLLEGAGLQRSLDGGQSWMPLQDDELRNAWEKMRASMEAMQAGSLTLAGKPEVLLATRGPLIARSDDNGASWQNAAISPALQGEVTVMVTADYHEDVVWAGTSGGQLLCSENRGRAWFQVAHALPPVRSLAAARLTPRA
jgi:photosystem II stability/assembly factor-like uncharacterized protein